MAQDGDDPRVVRQQKGKTFACTAEIDTAEKNHSPGNLPVHDFHIDSLLCGSLDYQALRKSSRLERKQKCLKKRDFYSMDSSSYLATVAESYVRFYTLRFDFPKTCSPQTSAQQKEHASQILSL
ncbi:hypothetical protein TNCV_4776851 [Trichonephila clavipes]|nr:hypothetical protein TNCV_4776851 [Trichonephila clavipes]